MENNYLNGKSWNQLNFLPQKLFAHHFCKCSVQVALMENFINIIIIRQPLNRALWPHGSEGLSPYWNPLQKEWAWMLAAMDSCFGLIGPRQHGIAHSFCKGFQYGLSPSDPWGHSALFSGCVIISTYVRHSYIYYSSHIPQALRFYFNLYFLWESEPVC